MKRLLWLATRVYPPAWRQRYGAEFEALLEDTTLQRGDVWDVLRGAFIMRMTKVNLVTIAAACAVAGALIAGVTTLVRFTGYTSTGTIAVQATDSSQTTAQFDLRGAMRRALSRASLAEIIQRPALKLYESERTQLPLEDVIEQMRRDTTLRFVKFESGRITARVSFHYSDATVAQRTTEVLMERLRTEFAKQAPLQVIGQAALGEPTLSGKRSKLVGMGALAGLAVGLLFGGMWSLARNRQRWNLRRIAGFAVAGAVVGLCVGLLVPNVFISTAVLSTSQPVDVHAILSEEHLAGVAHMLGIALKEMKAAIRVQIVDGTAYMISYQDHDPVRAQRVTRGLIMMWVQTGTDSGSATVTEVLDPPSMPASPIKPNRLTITLMGTFAGLLLGLGASRFRQPAVLVRRPSGLPL